MALRALRDATVVTTLLGERYPRASHEPTGDRPLSGGRCPVSRRKSSCSQGCRNPLKNWRPQEFRIALPPFKVAFNPILTSP
eukprot:6479576-Amphidinium_carterae.2